MTLAAVSHNPSYDVHLLDLGISSALGPDLAQSPSSNHITHPCQDSRRQHPICPALASAVVVVSNGDCLGADEKRFAGNKHGMTSTHDGGSTNSYWDTEKHVHIHSSTASRRTSLVLENINSTEEPHQPKGRIHSSRAKSQTRTNYTLRTQHKETTDIFITHHYISPCLFHPIPSITPTKAKTDARSIRRNRKIVYRPFIATLLPH